MVEISSLTCNLHYTMCAFFETMGITRNDFYTGNKIGIGVADCFQKSIRGEKFREHFDLVFFPECVASGQAIEEKARQEAFFADVMKVNRLMGFDLTDWGIASVPVYSVYRTLEKEYQSSDYDFWLFLKDDGKKEALKILVSEMHKRPDPYPGILAFVELLREYDREMMQAYIDGLLSYVHFVSSHAGLDGRRERCAVFVVDAVRIQHRQYLRSFRTLPSPFRRGRSQRLRRVRYDKGLLWKARRIRHE